MYVCDVVQRELCALDRRFNNIVIILITCVGCHTVSIPLCRFAVFLSTPTIQRLNSIWSVYFTINDFFVTPKYNTRLLKFILVFLASGCHFSAFVIRTALDKILLKPTDFFLNYCFFNSFRTIAYSGENLLICVFREILNTFRRILHIEFCLFNKRFFFWSQVDFFPLKCDFFCVLFFVRSFVCLFW